MMDNVLEHSIDVHGDGSLIKTLIHDCEEEWNISGTRKYVVDGHINITVPLDDRMTYDKLWDIHYGDVVREAQERNIKDVNVRCKYRILLTNDDWGRVERDGFNTRDVSYVITLLGYTTVDDIVVKFDRIHALVFEGHLQRQVHASLLSKCNELRPTSAVTTRRI